MGSADFLRLNAGVMQPLTVAMVLLLGTTGLITNVMPD